MPMAWPMRRAWAMAQLSWRQAATPSASPKAHLAPDPSHRMDPIAHCPHMSQVRSSGPQRSREFCLRAVMHACVHVPRVAAAPRS